MGITEEILHKTFYTQQSKPAPSTFTSLRIVYASKTKWQINDPTSFSLLTTYTISSQTPYPFTSRATSFISLNFYLCSHPLSPNSWHPILSTQQSISQILSPFLQFPLPALSLNSLLFFSQFPPLLSTRGY